MSAAPASAARAARAARAAHPGRVSIVAIVSVFALVEFTSGIIQGYYTPMLTDLARHFGVADADVNWLEGAQLMLSAVVVPLLAKFGDRVGHKRMLVLSTALTALASFGLALAPSWPIFLIAWALQGFYVVWLPLEVALVWLRAERAAEAANAADAESGATRAPARPAALTRSAAGLLVAALQLGAIAGALAGGALIDVLPLGLVLLIPAVAVAACLVAIIVGVRELPPAGRHEAGVDWIGAALLTLALLALTGGLVLMRLEGAGSPLPWLAIAAGIALVWPFARWELRHADPIVDARMFADSALWPVFLTAGLFGVSVLGAQAPLSTFARTDPAIAGFGLGTSGFQTSLLIGAYVLSLVVGALLLPLASRIASPRLALLGAMLLVAAGYLLFIPLHGSYAQVLTNMLIAGLGSGMLVAALPAAAAAAAPRGSTGVATGLTNATKTVGGAIASCVFGIALAQGVAAATGADGAAAEAAAGAAVHGRLEGYVTVWLVCGGTALLGALSLLIVPKTAFRDAEPDAEATAVTAGHL